MLLSTEPTESTHTPLIPAPAGIQPVARKAVLILGPRFRGDERKEGCARSQHRSHAALFGANAGCTTAPLCVSAVALTISSSQLTASTWVFLSIKISRKL